MCSPLAARPRQRWQPPPQRYKQVGSAIPTACPRRIITVVQLRLRRQARSTCPAVRVTAMAPADRMAFAGLWQARDLAAAWQPATGPARFSVRLVPVAPAA